MKRIKRFVGGVLASKTLWRILFVPLVLVAGFVAYNLYSGSQNSGGVKHVTVLTSGNAQQVQADMQATMKAGNSVFFEICTGDVCKEQVTELDKVAAEYEGKIMFVQINPSDVPDLAQSAAQAAGKAAYPTHYLLTPNGEFAETGLLPAAQLKTFIESSISSHLVRVTQANTQQVMKQVQSSGQAFLVVACTTDICKLLTPALEQTAMKYQGKVTIVLVDVTQGSELGDVVAQAVGGYVYPAYVFVNTQGGMVPYAGLLSAEDLTQFVEAGLKAKPAPADGATATPDASGTAPATPDSGK